MTADELVRAFKIANKSLTESTDLMRFITTALREKVDDVAVAISQYGGLSISDVYINGIVMGMLIKKVLDEDRIIVEEVMKEVNSIFKDFGGGRDHESISS